MAFRDEDGRRTRSWRRRTLPALFGLVVACVLIAALGGIGHPAAAPPAPPPPAVPVAITHVVRQDVPVYLSGLGQVQATNTVTIRSRVDGTLLRIPVAEGQEIKAGTLVAEIDPRPYQAALDQALAKRAQDAAQLVNAHQDLARYATLAQRDFASRQQLDTQRATVAQLTAGLAGDSAAVEAARVNLSFCTIASPIPGRVGLIAVDPGNLVRATDAGGIVTIAQDQPISVLFTLPEADLQPVRAEMKRRPVPVEALSGDAGPVLDRGRLATPDNTIDPTTGTIRFKATFPNPHDLLWPGQFVTAKLLLRTDRGVLALPLRAVLHGPDGLYVYVVHPDGTAWRQQVTAETVGETAVITQGLTAGQEVVLAGQSRLDDGTRIRVEPLGQADS